MRAVASRSYKPGLVARRNKSVRRVSELFVVIAVCITDINPWPWPKRVFSQSGLLVRPHVWCIAWKAGLKVQHKTRKLTDWLSFSCVPLYCTGCFKIKRHNTKTAISQKCVNIFASNFARLFNTQLLTSLLFRVIFTRRTPKWQKLKLKERILQLNNHWFL